MLDGRMYVVTFTPITVTLAQDLFEITPADDKPCIVHALFLDQLSDAGDAEEEFLRIQVIRGHTTSGSSGSSATPAPIKSTATAAAGFTAEVNNTTQATAGTTTLLHAGGFNIRAGMGLILTPEMRWGVSQANTTLVVRLTVAPTDAITLTGTLYVEELG